MTKYYSVEFNNNTMHVSLQLEADSTLSACRDLPCFLSQEYSVKYVNSIRLASRFQECTNHAC